MKLLKIACDLGPFRFLRASLLGVLASVIFNVTLPAMSQERCRGLALKEQVLMLSESLPDESFRRSVKDVAYAFRPCFANWCRCDVAGFERDLKAVIFENLSERNLLVYGGLKHD